MKNFLKLFMLLLAGAFFSTAALAQSNASLTVQTLQGCDIYVNGSGQLLITVGNTGPSTAIPTGRVQVQITVPTSISIPTGQTVTGWTITSLNAQTVNVCNSTTVTNIDSLRI